MNKLKICLAFGAKNFHLAASLVRKVNITIKNSAFLYKKSRLLLQQQQQEQQKTKTRYRQKQRQKHLGNSDSHLIVFLNIENRIVMS